jgi:tetratricopeptide (TPR) repeat protein
MIVKDEENNLSACLESAAGLVDEMIVVDTGSTDRTREVAARAGARVFDFPWSGDFAAARNESLRHATAPWIFWLDADERLDAENRGRLGRLFDSLQDGIVAYSMKQVSLPSEPDGTPAAVDHVRLFPNHPGIRWEYRIHEQILLSIRRLGGKVYWTDVAINHHGYQDPALCRRKLERNLELLRQEHAARSDDPFVLFNLGWAHYQLNRLTEALGFLQDSLRRLPPNASIVPKLYALIGQTEAHLGRPEQALAAFRAGQVLYPDDAELIFYEAALLQDQGDLPRARERLAKLLERQPDGGPRGLEIRHGLALIARAQGNWDEAEAQWRKALAGQPAFLPAWVGLGEVFLAQGRRQELEKALDKLETLGPEGAAQAAALRTRP